MFRNSIPYPLPHWLDCGIGEVMCHGVDKDGMGIWFKRIDDRAKEFIRMFVRDYSS